MVDRRIVTILAAPAAMLGLTAATFAANIEHTIFISVDGLRPDAVTSQSAEDLPNFHRLRSEAAFTDNARTDYDYTSTLPNHVTMFTGRPVMGAAGHDWTSNSPGPAEQTLHTHKGSYVSSVFDVVRDAGLRAGIFTGKVSLSLFDQSYELDAFHHSGSDANVTNTFVNAMQNDPLSYAVLHFHGPDSAGHNHGWMSEQYHASVRTVDGYLQQVFDLVENDPQLKGRTAIILTSDHGGEGTAHWNAALPSIYTIPLYVWAPGVAAPGADLYELNPETRLDPLTGRPDNDAPIQPIRHADATNLALEMLGLDPIPGSVLNAEQDLVVPEPGSALLLGLGAALALARPRRQRPAA